MQRRRSLRVWIALAAGALISMVSVSSQSAAADVDAVSGDQSAQVLAASGPFKYVALGDSFSSGAGGATFFQPNNQCARSTTAYSTMVELPGNPGASIYQLSQAGTPDIQWGFQACAGSMTPSVLTNGLFGDPIPQLALDRSADIDNAYDLPVDASTSLVTITIGGNDIGFGQFMNFCGFSANCTTEKYQGKLFSEWMATLRNELSPKLDRVYSTIRTQAPQAKVLVLGYPQLFPAAAAQQKCASLAQRTYTKKVGGKVEKRTIGYSTVEQKYLRQVTTDLNALIAARAQANGVQFVAVDSFFAGHEVCGKLGEWINGPSLQRPTEGQNWLTGKSFHPNSFGDAMGYAAAINQQLNR
jgi:lysophospholipase L1-like esterase